MIFSRRKPQVAAIALLVLSALLLSACGEEADMYVTTSTTIFPSQPSFMEELSGEGYGYPTMFVDGQEGAEVLIVWIAVMIHDETRATDDAIFDHAVALAEKYGATDSTEGRMRVGLFDGTDGGTIKDLIYASRDFDLTEASTVTNTTTSVTAPTESNTSTTRLFPAVDRMLGQLRLEVYPREGVRVAVGDLREVPSNEPDPRKRLIEGEIIIENQSNTPFAYRPDDFRLYVGPFQTQIEGMTASTDFRVQDAVLAPAPFEGHEFLIEGTVAPGNTLHDYLLTWVADRGTESYGLQYDPSDAQARDVGRGYVNRIQP